MPITNICDDLCESERELGATFLPMHNSTSLSDCVSQNALFRNNVPMCNPCLELRRSLFAKIPELIQRTFLDSLCK